MAGGMVKVIAPGSQDFGEGRVSIVKLARGGLRGEDFKSLVKRAGHEFADAMRKVDLKPGDVPIHLIALGAGEYFGMNRNGDYFGEPSLEKYHPTFVKHARFYRNHANKDPEKSYGVIKYSSYNKPMHRVELLVALNGDKKAAARNGGLVAEEELEKLAGDDEIAVSMACRVPFDVCSGCGNKARTRAEYCKGEDQGGHCKMGGLRDRITLVDDQGKQLYADNPDPTFFDISKVFRPADRIAWVTGQMKAASASVLSGAQLAEEWRIAAPAHLAVDDPRSARWVKLAQQLAGIERRIDEQGPGYHGLAWAPSVQPAVSWDDHGVRPEQAVAALCATGVSPPLEGYLVMGGLGDRAAGLAKHARTHLPGIYRRMLEDGTMTSVDPADYGGSPGVPPLAARGWAEKRAGDYGVGSEHVRHRVTLASLRGDTPPARPARRDSALVKQAGAGYELARSYALFKLALLDRLPRDRDFDGACGAAVRQNYA